jgi:hypothetical protein
MKNKIDWYINGLFKQRFDSYLNASEFFTMYFNEMINTHDIKDILNKKCVKFKRIEIYNIDENIPFQIFKTNLEFINFFEKNESDIVIKTKYITPDLRYYQEIKEKICKNNEGYKNIKLKNKPENLNEDWKPHPEFTNYYFERNTTRIYNIKIDKYIITNPVIENKERLICNLKWEAFYGKIPENKIVKFKNGLIKKKDPDHSELDNLECVYIHCNTCEKLIQSPESMNQIFCSKSCQIKTINKRHKNERDTDLIKYTRHKLYTHRSINKKYNILVDYDLEYLLSLGTNCYYCDILCKFGNEKENNNPDTLTFDKKNPEIGYVKENIVVCCWFCNRMKNQTSFEDWDNFINFIKNENVLELDLSPKEFATKSCEINLTNIYFHIKTKSPDYYPDLNKAKETFKEICKKQNYLDPFFNFFPVINLGSNCLFNASIDAIDATLPESEKHRPDNLQVIPKCFNYGKNILSNEDFIKEWKLRKFKTNFENCEVILPKDYYQKSYFSNFINC